MPDSKQSSFVTGIGKIQKQRCSWIASSIRHPMSGVKHPAGSSTPSRGEGSYRQQRALLPFFLYLLATHCNSKSEALLAWLFLSFLNLIAYAPVSNQALPKHSRKHTYLAVNIVINNYLLLTIVPAMQATGILL